jgi:putative intracellular protease/amidase
MSQPKILFIFTSADRTLGGGPTGYYLPEAAHPYYILSPNAQITFASPKGPNPPLDPRSVEQFKEDPDCARFLEDPEVKEKFANAIQLSQVRVEEYDAVFFPGGHGPVMDLAHDPLNAEIVSKFWILNKVVSAVCHGPAALTGGKDKNGESIFKGRSATGFTNTEEEAVKKTKEIPFLLETKIKELGGSFVRTDDWQEKVVVDGRLITGQNPASSKRIAHELLAALRE